MLSKQKNSKVFIESVDSVFIGGKNFKYHQLDYISEEQKRREDKKEKIMYRLEDIKPNEKVFIIKIVGDDADYITTESNYNESSFIDLIPDIENLIKNYSEPYKLEDLCDSKLDLPYSDYGVCHSLYSIDIKCIDVDGRIYDVELDIKLG